MQQPSPDLSDDRLGQEDDEVRAAIRFAAVTTVAASIFLVTAALLVSTCRDAGSVETVACGTPQRTLLSVGAPLILLWGGLRSLLRTYQVWRRRGTWWGWQGSGWFLLTLMLIALMMSTPLIIGLRIR